MCYIKWNFKIMRVFVLTHLLLLLMNEKEWGLINFHLMYLEGFMKYEISIFSYKYQKYMQKNNITFIYFIII